MVVYPTVYDEDRIQDESALLNTGTEKYDRASFEVTQLSRMALSSLLATCVVEFCAKYERIGVL